MLKSIKNFIYTWWFRYLLVTELYIVEPWERATIRILFDKLNKRKNGDCLVVHWLRVYSDRPS